MRLNSTHFKKVFLGVGVIITSIFVISLMFSTTPQKLGPGGVTGWFIALLFDLICIITIVLVLLKNRFTSGKQNPIRTLNSSFRTAFLAAIGVVSILALRSLGTLSIKDIILLVLVLIIIEVFLRTRGVLT